MEQCDCKKKKNIAYYEYIIIDKLMDFTDYDHYTLEPKYCPFCGKKRKKDNHETN